MKAKLLLALILCGALLATSYGAPAAAAPANAAPAPVKIVAPTQLPRSFENARVVLALTIDAQGVPHQIAPVGYLPEAVRKQLVSAVSQWRFAPKYQDGRAVATRVVLPLRLVDGDVS